MPIDPNIAMSYKPVGLDIAGAMQAAEERKLMQSRNALAGAQQAAAQDELNNALAARRYASGADLNDPQNAMRLFGFGKAGGDMFQSLQAGRASSAAARKSQLEASGVKAGQYRQALAFVDNPNAAMEWLQAHHDDPDMQDSPVARMPLDVALSRIPQDPAGFQQWKQQAALGIDKYIERNTMTAYEARPVATETSAGLEGITPTGETVWKRGAAPKSAGVTINMPAAENEFGKGLGKSAAENLQQSFKGARSASSSIANIERLGPLVNDPNFISGTLGDTRLAVAKALGLEGAEETQAYFSQMGRETAEVITSFGSGTAISDSDREYANKIAGGSIELTPAAIKRILFIRQQANREAIMRYNDDRRNFAVNNPNVRVDQYYQDIPVPPPPSVNYKGWGLQRDKNGNYAYVSPDGKSFQETQ